MAEHMDSKTARRIEVRYRRWDCGDHGSHSHRVQDFRKKITETGERIVFHVFPEKVRDTILILAHLPDNTSQILSV